jgi:hypothetical protein
MRQVSLRGVMVRNRWISSISLLILFAALAGCGGGNQLGSGSQNNGNSSVVLAMRDSAPSGVSILSAEVTLTGVTLAPGNVSLFSGSTTIELTRLQTDTAYVATATNIPAGAYTAVTLTFANPSLTIENDTSGTIGGCAVGSICTMAPTSTTHLSATVPLSSFSIASSTTVGLLIDVNLENLLTPALGADFSAGTTVTPFTPAGTGAPLVGAEDVVGHVTSINASSNTFTLTSGTASYTLKVDSASTFFQFPTNATCTTQGFACLTNNQVLSVDIGILSDGSLLARNILFEDADSSDVEVEGLITGTNLSSQQFNIVVLSVSGGGTGLSVGGQATVQYATSPQTPFDIDFVHADNVQISVSTSGFLFALPADLSVGQQVSVRRHSTLSGGQILADRVRLRSSRITATLASNASSIMNLTNPPSIFSGHGVTTIQVQTQAPTICSTGNAPNLCSNLILFVPVSVRGPLFNASGTRTILATRALE